MKKRSWLSLALAALLVLQVVGCGTKDTNSEIKTGGTLNISLHQDPPKLDPSFSTALVDRMVFQSIFDKLVEIDAKGKLVPMLAEKWDISQDGKAYTFSLRKGVKFHDGTEFNAEAVKFNFDRNMESTSLRKNELGQVANVKVVDANTVLVELKTPYAPFLSVLTDRAGMIVSPAAVKKYGENFFNNPVGTGPFVFKERVKGLTISLEKNPDYWQKGLPKLDKLVYKIITDANVALINLKSGQVDITNRFPLKEIETASADGKIVVSNEPTPGFRGFFLNVNKPPFDNKELRQAVEVMVDRESIVKVALNNAASPGKSPFPPANFAYGESDKFSKPDIAKAKDLLKKAGKPDGFTFTLKIDMDPLTQQIAQMLQSMLKPAGIQLNIEKMEFGSMLDQAKKGSFEAASIGWSGRIDPDQNIYDWFVSGGTQNYAKYDNKAVNKLLNDARIELNEGKRKALYEQTLEIVADEVPYIYLYHDHNVYGVASYVKGYTPNPDGMIRTDNLSINK